MNVGTSVSQRLESQRNEPKRRQNYVDSKTTLDVCDRQNPAVYFSCIWTFEGNQENFSLIALLPTMFWHFVCGMT